MSVSRDERRGTWTVQCWYRDWRGDRRKKTKRGFATKSEAKRWEQAFLARCEGTPSMTLSEFFELYEDDVRPRLKQSTWDTKEHMVRTKILPYLGE
ncbi:MAG: Arm DNA-binding domain-containing protein, partial [Olegusella sp.]|nr:Arm DNA-binding domain-containing protein [Olegusella sp.]